MLQMYLNFCFKGAEASELFFGTFKLVLDEF